MLSKNIFNILNNSKNSLKCSSTLLSNYHFNLKSYSTAEIANQVEPCAPIPNKPLPIWQEAKDAVKYIKSGDRVFIHGQAATPSYLINAMTEHALENDLRDIETIHLHLEGELPFVKPELSKHFRPNCLFVGGQLRQAVNDGRADYNPVFLSECPLLFRRNVLPIDVAIIHVSPPDKHGFCSLGVSVDIARAALQSAKVVIGQVNQMMPRTHGDGVIHLTHFDSLVVHNTPIYLHEAGVPSDVEKSIGKLIAENLVKDRATLQLGIGNIPNAVLSALNNHKDIGIHTETFSDGILSLLSSGVITNKYKTDHAGRITTTFCVGSQRLYDFVDDNQQVQFFDCGWTNSSFIIARQHKMTSINSCIEIDITGQVVSDSIGSKIYSGVGGQVDFARGSVLSDKGKSIIAMPSRTRKGIARIVPKIRHGAGVVTTRSHAHYIVTEYGIAHLWGVPLMERARRLIAIAHPDDREVLEKEAYLRFKGFDEENESTKHAR